jgi:hypothetical protein
MAKNTNSGSAPSMAPEQSQAGAADAAAFNESQTAPVVEAEGSDVAKQLAEMRALLESQAAEINSLRKQVNESQTAPVVVAAAMAKPDPTKVLDEKLDALKAQSDKIEEELLAGGQLFDCSMNGEPRMSKRVGGADGLHAKAKYEKYFGIRAVSDPNKAISVSPVAAAA